MFYALKYNFQSMEVTYESTYKNHLNTHKINKDLICSRAALWHIMLDDVRAYQCSLFSSNDEGCFLKQRKYINK